MTSIRSANGILANAGIVVKPGGFAQPANWIEAIDSESGDLVGIYPNVESCLAVYNESQKRKCLLSVLLPIELTNGNDGRGNKWFRSATLRERYEAHLRRLGYQREPFAYPVEVHVTRILGRKQMPWDPSSIGRGNWKEIEDSLVALGWWHDDSTKWITEVRFFQEKTRRKDGPATLVEVYEAT